MKSILSCLLLFALASLVCAVDTKHPNVLFIVADDLNKTLPCYGNTLVKAPNVERLAARAVRFDRAYCQYPVCMPSRTSFMSGRRPESTGKFGNEGATRTPQLQDALFMPQYFKANGYFTARLGKIFHIGADVPECWDVTEEGSPGPKIVYTGQEVERLGLTDEVVAHHEFSRHGGDIGGGEGSTYSILKGGKDKLIDVRNGQRAAELITQHAGQGQPFFLACGFRRPHQPHVATTDFFDLYPADKMPLPEKGGPKLPGIKGPVPDNDSREALRGYLACVTFMDEQLGHVLDAMDANKLWDNTIVVFLGDHGYLLGSRGGWWGKGVLYDEAASTALLIAAPGQAKGVGCPRVVEFLDLYPTLADLCGLPEPAGIEGRSLAPLLAKPDEPWPHAAYTMQAPGNTPKGLAVSTERFRYLENNNQSVELYDVQADPQEWVNLAANPAHADDLAAMKKLADDYKAKFRKKP